MPKLAIVGGTGVSQILGLAETRIHAPETPFGRPSATIIEGVLGGSTVLFLPRHGIPHKVAPHKINYRANLSALKELGATEVVATNAVGSIRPEWLPGHMVFPDEIIDYTWGREHTLYDGKVDALEHVDMSEPYATVINDRLQAAAEKLCILHSRGGVYGATQGPRLETPAEVRRLARDGCDLIGMTGMPEAALARELGLAYGSVCLVVNPAAGVGEGNISMAKINQVLQVCAGLVARLLQEYVSSRADSAPAPD
jgi:5'-methylthioinosine phosphorylase